MRGQGRFDAHERTSAHLSCQEDKMMFTTLYCHLSGENNLHDLIGSMF
jgi:hypothetical protein